MNVQQTLPERLNDLARRTEMRIGNHPDADLCREAARRVTDLEAQLAVETTPSQPTDTPAPKPAARRTKKDS